MRKTIAFCTTLASLLTLVACNDTPDPKPDDDDGKGGSGAGYAGKPGYGGQDNRAGAPGEVGEAGQNGEAGAPTITLQQPSRAAPSRFHPTSR